ncbi:MAG TPA: hypothetical protein PLL18_15940, partial [Flavobacteriales bacterium]|nr:hypothetical protein [Flavobacteriales bacterium]
MELKGLNIMIVSSEGWGDMWYSKHNYAYELARHNEVLFVGPTDRWKPAFLKGCNISVVPALDRLRLLRYNNVLPAITQLSYRWNNAIVSQAIRKQLDQLQWPVDLFISFDPSRLHQPQDMGAKASLFIAVDKYNYTQLGERYLFGNVDGIVTISSSFNAFYKPFNKPILTIGHGISSEEFEASPVETDLRSFGLYIGGIDKRMDLSMVEQLVQAFPEVPFVFIGRFALPGQPLAEDLFLHGRYPNVRFLGVKPFKELKRWIAASHFCLAPMDVSLSGNDISHHKVFQYLALGKPVFSPVFSEYGNIAELLYMDN